MSAHDRETARDNARWAQAFVAELARSGVRHFCVSPGMRCAPLTLAIAEHTYLTSSVHIDERCAGFFALGYGRAGGAPAAVVCTSGTAGANLLPAIVEAHQSCTPMIVLTADRPPELRDTGAWQAIDQIKLYGSFTRWFAEVPTPSSHPALANYVPSVASRAVAEARGRPAGPVHLNIPFREPLVPLEGAAAEDGGATAEVEGSADHAVGGEHRAAAVPDAAERLEGAPWITVPPTTPVLGSEFLDALAETIARAPRGLVLAGPIDAPPGYAAAVARLGAEAGYPILAEPAGGLRYGAHDRSRVVTGYDVFLRAGGWVAAHVPEVVVRFGQSLTWRPVADYVARHPSATQIVVDPDSTWDDPTRGIGLRLPVEPVTFAYALSDRLAGVIPRSKARVSAARDWFDEWRRASDHVRRAREGLVRSDGGGSVMWVYQVLSDVLSDGTLVYAANSMAVRDLDTFTPPARAAVRVVANRGAAGIDGTLSSALGAAYAARCPTVLLTGDMAFVHDINGLTAAQLKPLNLTVLVLNDEGGGIFAHLPTAACAADVFEKYFRAAPGVDCAAACAAYGVTHESVGEPATLRKALGRSLESAGVAVIEVKIDQQANTLARRRLWEEVMKKLGEGS